jgi:hypothetical protein
VRKAPHARRLPSAPSVGQQEGFNHEQSQEQTRESLFRIYKFTEIKTGEIKLNAAWRPQARCRAQARPAEQTHDRGAPPPEPDNDIVKAPPRLVDGIARA